VSSEEGVVTTDLDLAITTELDEMLTRLDRARARNIGFPGATDFDYTALAPIVTRQLLNNVGDPYTDGVAVNHTKAFERQVIDFLADLLRAPQDDRWGYVTSGASEGTLYALYLARTLYPHAIVYHSSAAHYSIGKAIDLLAMASVTLQADESGEIDYANLAAQVGVRREHPVIVVANIGTTMSEAIDDVRRITTVSMSQE
jgi:histidine decarboxylase